ncbi:OB-fold domain-containing protein [Nocardioides sp. NPDC092400]|uniref:OB-fold domain-containing protein n=1 Tax=Nocardioides sp. NPDC092400 TaxID=3155196 RepID=UPI0034231CDB
MPGIRSYATYLPAYRLDPRDSGVRAGRVVAAFDEDATTMAVAAAERLVDAAGSLEDAARLTLATSSPPYLDKTNAVAVAAALGLPATVPASDAGTTARSVMDALDRPGLLVAADVRVGKPGSGDERSGGDGAAAVLIGETELVAEVIGRAAVNDELLDRWRDPLSRTGEQWEERFGFERHAAAVRATAAAALADAGLEEADHVVLTSANSAVTKRAGALVKGRSSTTGSPIGFAGTADPLLGLAGVLDVAGAGETVLLLSAVDGCDAAVMRTTDLLLERRQRLPLAEQVAAPSARTVPYATYLGWRGLLDRETPRRPEPDRPAGPPSARGAGWKFAFTGSRCVRCGFVHLPPVRVCRGCGATDQMKPVPAARLAGRVATYTVDRLAFSPSPPVVDVVVDFDGGGRTTLELSDADPDVLEVGTEVEVVFRRLFTAGRVHNYFWKARALPGRPTERSEQ